MRAVCALGYLIFTGGDPAAAEPHIEEAVRLARELGDPVGTALTLSWLGALRTCQGNLDLAARVLTESLALYRELGQPWGIGGTLFWLGEVARLRGEYERGAPLLEESLATARAHGILWGIPYVLGSLARIAVAQGAYERATTMLQESLRVRRDMDDARGIAFNLEELAWVAAAEGRAARAGRLLGAAGALYEWLGIDVHPALRTDHDRALAATRAALGDAGFAAAWAEGAALGLERAVDDALQAPVSAARPDRAAPLTAREGEVAALIAQGSSNRRIAETLVITEGTAANHVKHILRKLDFAARSQIAAWAVERGLALPTGS